MSHAQLQRVLVRMLYDPAFADAVYDDVEAATGDVDLTADERRWLVEADRRAWRTDPLRRSRSLHALLEEFPASAAAALAQGRELSDLDGFFSSPEFHGAIQRRRSLAATFAEWLSALAEPPVPALSALEGAVAAARRPATATPGPGQLALRPGVRAVSVPAGTSVLLGAIAGALGEDPVGRLVDGGVRLKLPELGSEPGEHLIVEAGPEGVSLSGASEALAMLCQAAERPVARAAVRLVACNLGCNPDEAEELIEDLVADGLLVAGESTAK